VAIAATGTQFREAHLSAEARILAERFGMPGFGLSRAGAVPRVSTMERLAAGVRRAFTPAPAPLDRLEHLSNSVGERLTMGQEVYRCVRVRNAGTTVLRSSEAPVASVQMCWFAPEGRPLPECTLANELPIDLEPGREITLILRLRAPALPGRFELRAHLAVAGHAIDPPFLSIPVQIIRCELPVFEYEYFPDVLEYGPDHHIAMVETVEFMARHYPGKSLLLLEIGGGVHPTGHALTAHGHRVVSSDISHSQSILGALYYRHHRPDLEGSLAFASCDGTHLPFADGAFDGVVMYSAFHHFAEPLALLHEMKRVSGPRGFIFFGAETCAPDPTDLAYRAELARGINEQMWTLVEYTDFFRQASLRVARARVDHNTLRAGLMKS
jgi:ubiquinone/menaquinone biosynthesis C-methylase UbiE